MFFMRDVTITFKLDPEVITLAREVNTTVNRWMDRNDVARFLYDQMKAIKANLDNNFR
jgi:hypothetical protein